MAHREEFEEVESLDSNVGSEDSSEPDSHLEVEDEAGAMEGYPS